MVCWYPHADEEFGGDVEIPEEIQTQLLEDYQRECEEKGRKDSESNTKESDDETVTVQDTKEKDGNSTQKSSEGKMELLEELKVDLTRTTETASKPSPSSTGKV